MMKLLLAVSLATSAPPLGAEHLDEAVRGRTVLVVGDSWARTIGAGMIEVAGRSNTIVNAGLGGCGIMEPVGEPACKTWREQWTRLVDEHRPDAVLLMVAFWDSSAQQTEPDGPRRDLGDPEFRARFIRHLDEGVAILTARGAPVHLMNAHLDYPINAILKDASHRHSLPMLDLREQLCTDTGCPKKIDGVDVYDETGHASRTACARLGRWILNTMFRP